MRNTSRELSLQVRPGRSVPDINNPAPARLQTQQHVARGANVLGMACWKHQPCTPPTLAFSILQLQDYHRRHAAAQKLAEWQKLAGRSLPKARPWQCLSEERTWTS